jgi:hypothetical protein
VATVFSSMKVSQVQGYLAHKNAHPPEDHDRSLGIRLLQGPTGGLFLISEASLYASSGAASKPCLGKQLCNTGVPRFAPPKDPTAGRCLGPYDGPRGWAFSYDRATPAHTKPDSRASSA